ncbi:MAG: DUF6687 family protein [Bacteroidia bacterium]
MKQFLPFKQVETDSQVVVVDAMHHHGLIYSHWRGAPKLAGLHDDTSLGIVLNAIKAGHEGVDYPLVTNNHFDVDGFLGVWSLFEPALALRYEAAFREAALIGDFREYDPNRTGADLGLKLVCWLNEIERRDFYQPFGAKDEAEACVPKYEYCLPRFAEVVEHPERFEDVWGPEYAQVIAHTEIIQSAATKLDLLSDIRLLIVETPEPLHYYALFGQSREADMVLTTYEGQRYELEYKYTTWVDTDSRCAYPRLPFDTLADQLNAQEASAQIWWGDRIMDTGPQLRLNSRELSKLERFDHPFKREIFPSNISSEVLKAAILSHYRMRFAITAPQNAWTWTEMREVAARNAQIEKR